MYEVYWAPNQVERRAIRLSETTLTNLPSLGWSRGTLEFNEPLKRVRSRASLIRLLDDRIALSVERNHPLCLVVVEFQSEAKAAELEAVLYSVARMSNLMLRPTDIVVRYGDKSVAFILHATDQDGAHRAVARLTEQLSRGIGKHHILLIPVFGFASILAGASESAENMLLKAETNLGHDVELVRSQDFLRSRERQSFGAKLDFGVKHAKV